MSVDTSWSRLRALPARRGSPAPRLALRYSGFALAALAGARFVPAAASWLLLWLAGSNGLLAYAYATNRVGLFGKRDDGRLSVLASLAFLPYLALVWGFFALKLAGLRREPCYARIAPDLYVGRKPRRAELPASCDLVVDLTCEFIEAADVVAACGYRCFPILNRHVPEPHAFERLLRELSGFDGTIYIHCGAGRGRSAMLAAALLVLRGEAADVDAAERELRALRPGVSLHAAQRALVTSVCALLLRDAAPHSRATCATTKCA